MSGLKKIARAVIEENRKNEKSIYRSNEDLWIDDFIL